MAGPVPPNGGACPAECRGLSRRMAGTKENRMQMHTAYSWDWGYTLAMNAGTSDNGASDIGTFGKLLSFPSGNPFLILPSKEYNACHK